MNPRKLFATLALIAISQFHLLASGDEKENELEKKSFFVLESQFREKLQSPFFATQSMSPMTAYIKFHITNSFKVVIEDMACSDVRLRSHVERMLAEQIILIDRENVNKSYSLKLTFK